MNAAPQFTFVTLSLAGLFAAIFIIAAIAILIWLLKAAGSALFSIIVCVSLGLVGLVTILGFAAIRPQKVMRETLAERRAAEVAEARARHEADIQRKASEGAPTEAVLIADNSEAAKRTTLPGDVESEPERLTRNESADSAASQPDSSWGAVTSSDTSELTMPAWISQESQRVEDSFQTVISAGPYARLMDCQQQLDEKLVSVTRAYIQREFDLGSGKLVELSPADLRERIIDEEFVAAKTHDFGPLAEDQRMYQVFQLLKFDLETSDYLRRVCRQAVVETRLWYAGSLLATVLVILTTLFGYAKLDSLSTGHYRLRLRFVAGVVILTTLGSLVVLARLVPLV